MRLLLAVLATATPIPHAALLKIDHAAGYRNFLPTRMLPGFTYRGWNFRGGVLRVEFRNPAGIAAGVAGAGPRVGRGPPLEPVVDVGDQAALVVVHVDGCGDVHRIDEHESVVDARLPHERLDAVGDVQVVAAVRRLEREVLGRVL